MLGCTSFVGIDSVAWGDNSVPNIPDYDLVIVSVPHITEEFLKIVDIEYFKELRRSLIEFLHSGGKMVVLVSASFGVERPSLHPKLVDTIGWCPIRYGTTGDTGRSIVWKQDKYRAYLSKMSEWTFCLTIPQHCHTDELGKFYGDPHKTLYRIKMEPFIQNRYSCTAQGF